MSEGIIIALITATGAVIGSVALVVKQWLGERRAERNARLEAKQDEHDELLVEYRHMLHEQRERGDRLQADLDRERTDRDRLRTERDEWRRQAQRDGRRLEQILEAKERPE